MARRTTHSPPTNPRSLTSVWRSAWMPTRARRRPGSSWARPATWPPEQAAGKSKEIGPGADVYALGALLYDLLVGRPPFKAATPQETVDQVLLEDPIPPRRLQPKVPRDLE